MSKKFKFWWSALKKIFIFIVVIFFGFLAFGCSSETEQPEIPDEEEKEEIQFEEMSIDEMQELNNYISSLDMNELENDVEYHLITNYGYSFDEEGEGVFIDHITVNDQFVYLMKSDILNLYGDDVDWDKLFKDILIGAVVLGVTIACSAIPGGQAAVLVVIKSVIDISSKVSTIMTIVGAAIDAGIEGYKAIQEGGDLTYVLGHMLNGVVDGVKWSCLFAPLSAIGFGIGKAVKYAKALKIFKASKVLSFLTSEIGEKATSNILKNADEVFKLAKQAAKETSKEAADEIYKTIAEKLLANTGKEATSEIGEVLGKDFIKNIDEILNVVGKYDVFDVYTDLSKSLQKEFLGSATEEAFQATRKAISTAKNVSSLGSDVQKLILDNLDDFSKYFNQIITKELRESILQNAISNATGLSLDLSKQLMEQLSKSIKAGNFFDVLEAFPSGLGDVVDINNLTNKVISQPGMLNLVSYGATQKKIKQFVTQVTIADQMRLYSDISNDALKTVTKKVLKGEYDDIAKVFSDLGHGTAGDYWILKKIDYDNFKIALDSVGLYTKNKSLLKSIAIKDLTYNFNINESLINKILNTISADDLNPDELAQLYLLVNNTDILTYISDLGSKTLFDDLSQYIFINNGVTPDVIECIKQGQKIFDEASSTKLLTSEQLLSVSNVLEITYMNLGQDYYDNLVLDIKEAAQDYMLRLSEKTTDAQKIYQTMVNDLESFDLISKVLYYNSDLSEEYYITNAIIKSVQGYNDVIKQVFKQKSYILSSNVDNFISAIQGNSITSLDELKQIFPNDYEMIINNLKYSEPLIKALSEISSQSLDSFVSLVQCIGFNSLFENGLVGQNAFDVFNDILTNRLSKAEIISKYGDECYSIIVENGTRISNVLNSSHDTFSKELAKTILFEQMDDKFGDEICNQLINGESLENLFSVDEISNNYDTLLTYGNIIGDKKILEDLVSNRVQKFSEYAITELPINYYLAGKEVFVEGFGIVKFTEHGHPIFDEYAIASITMELSGNSSKDIRLANLLYFGTDKGISGYTWHHLEDGKSMILIPTELHQAVKHTGGAHYLTYYLKK